MKSLSFDISERPSSFAEDKCAARRRATLGQFFTPPEIARFMASLLGARSEVVRLLDPGAGEGALFTACVESLCSRSSKPREINVTAYELDKRLIGGLGSAVEWCRETCAERGIAFNCRVVEGDFIQAAIEQLEGGMFSPPSEHFTSAILNPPYRKIRSDSEARQRLKSVGMETSNLYSAFVWLAARLLEPGGEFVAITPRSFCNGPYFRPFRKALLEMMTLRRIHIFDSRDLVFQKDDVLQENVILHAIKAGGRSSTVQVSSSSGLPDEAQCKDVPYDCVLPPGDRDFFIHIPSNPSAVDIRGRMENLETALPELGLFVSTGRVVDFRARKFLRREPEKNTFPLIYPCHFSNGFVEWPKSGSKKPNALSFCPETEHLFVPSGHYVLTRRFSAKEEPRRIVAAVFDPDRVPGCLVGFENHLNYFHLSGGGMPAELARGLAAFLNSSPVDLYLRQFNGHTQVNATDLRKIRYPSRARLVRLGNAIQDAFPSQEGVDALVEKELFHHDQHRRSC